MRGEECAENAADTADGKNHTNEGRRGMLLLGKHNYDQWSTKTYGTQTAIEKGHRPQQGLVP